MEGTIKVRKLGIIYICTGDYVRLADIAISSHARFLCPDVHKTYFVFTDNDPVHLRKYENEDNKIVWVKKAKVGWPYDTLYRFKWINEIRDIVHQEGVTDLFFFNANLKSVTTISIEELCSGDGGIVAAIHPCFEHKTPNQFSYERNPSSSCYIAFGEGSRYYQGCLYGASTENFLKMSEELERNIVRDEANGIMAIWHDESHLNHHLWKNRPSKELNPGYIYPEGVNYTSDHPIRMISIHKWNFGLTNLRN